MPNESFSRSPEIIKESSAEIIKAHNTSWTKTIDGQVFRFTLVQLGLSQPAQGEFLKENTGLYQLMVKMRELLRGLDQADSSPFRDPRYSFEEFQIILSASAVKFSELAKKFAEYERSMHAKIAAANSAVIQVEVMNPQSQQESSPAKLRSCPVITSPSTGKRSIQVPIHPFGTPGRSHFVTLALDSED